MRSLPSIRRMRTRWLGAISVGLMLGSTLGVGTANAEPEKRVHNSMQIVFSQLSPDKFCTIGAVGSDDYGREIAISAGHCIIDPNYSDREIPENVIPVYHRQDIAFGPIGYVRYFKDPDWSLTGHPTKDYMIIELVPEVTPSAQGPYLKQTGEVEVPGGTASPNALNPALDNERLLRPTWWFYNNEIVVSGQLGVWYAHIAFNWDGVYRSFAPHRLGDSGGPTIWHVPGSAYPSEENGFQAEGPWAGITKAISLETPAYQYTSSANILADLRARDAADPADIYGAGFEVTHNP